MKFFTKGVTSKEPYNIGEISVKVLDNLEFLLHQESSPADASSTSNLAFGSYICTCTLHYTPSILTHTSGSMYIGPATPAILGKI